MAPCKLSSASSQPRISYVLLSVQVKKLRISNNKQQQQLLLYMTHLHDASVHNQRLNVQLSQLTTMVESFESSVEQDENVRVDSVFVRFHFSSQTMFLSCCHVGSASYLCFLMLPPTRHFSHIPLSLAPLSLSPYSP
jgi:hypothetical protein